MSDLGLRFCKILWMNIYQYVFFSFLMLFFDRCGLYSGKYGNFIFGVFESSLACEPAEGALNIHYNLPISPLFAFSSICFLLTIIYSSLVSRGCW